MNKFLVADLTMDDLVLLDAKLDAAIPSAALADIPLNEALTNLLRLHEDECRFWIPKLAGPTGEGLREGAKLSHDAMHFAVMWLHLYCAPNSTLNNSKKSDAKLYLLSKQILTLAQNYSRAWDMMAMLRRGNYSARKISDTDIEYRTNNIEAEAGEIADQIINNPDQPNISGSNTKFLPPMAELTIEARPKRASRGLVSYTFPKKAYEVIRNGIASEMAHLWELPPTMDLGGYTVAEFKTFWIALFARCLTHTLICLRAGQSDIGVEGVGIDSLLEFKTKAGWAHELSRLCGLEYKKISLIIEDLIYNPSLNNIAKKGRPNVLQQPFFNVGANQIVVANQLVIGSNAERNIWALIGIIRQKVQDRLKDDKEVFWIDNLKTKYAVRAIQAYGPFKFKLAGKPGDLDVFLHDPTDNFGLAVELKWHTAPDRINEISNLNEELKKGISQAKASLEWIHTDIDALSQKTGIAIDVLKRCEVQALVLSKNGTGKGQLDDQEIPVCSERILDWLLLTPHQTSLKAAWKTIAAKGFYPISGKHYYEGDVHFSFAGLNFKGVNLGMQVTRSYDPSVDLTVLGS